MGAPGAVPRILPSKQDASPPRERALRTAETDHAGRVAVLKSQHVDPQAPGARHRLRDPAENRTVRPPRLDSFGAAGLTLQTIQRLLPCVRNDHLDFKPCNELRRILAQQVGLIDERIDSLSQSRKMLAGFLSSVNQ